MISKLKLIFILLKIINSKKLNEDKLNKFFSRESFENVDSWLKEIKNNSNPDVKVFLIGNKSDLEDK